MDWLQQHWQRITLLHLILYPLSLCFRALVCMRCALYRSGLHASIKLPVPVVVVGNISVGGTGKTPLVLALVEQFIRHGLHPVIVSRGYGGAAVVPQRVAADCQALQVGDEPLLMARRCLCPVWIGRDRAAAAQAALQAHPECDVVVCDDGLQHYRLQRDAEIAVIDGTRGFGNGWMLPAGPLREPVSRLATVDAVLVNGGQAAASQYAMQLSGEIFHNLQDPARQVSASYFQALNTHAVAGIGNPQRYFEHLEKLGIRFVAHAFRDHHAYTSADLAFSCDAILLTEKDAVKCAEFADARYWVLRVEAQIDPVLVGHILRKIKPHGSQAA